MMEGKNFYDVGLAIQTQNQIVTDSQTNGHVATKLIASANVRSFC